MITFESFGESAPNAKCRVLAIALGVLVVVNVVGPERASAQGGGMLCKGRDYVSLERMAGSADIAIDGHLAYVCRKAYGISIVDISDLAAPVTLSTFEGEDRIQGVALRGRLAHLADGYSGLKILDASNPASPVQLGAIETPGRAEDIALVGDTAFVADWLGGMSIIDVSDPTTPTFVAQFASSGHARVVAAEDTTVFLGDDETLRIRPGLWVEDEIVYVADSYNGLQLVSTRLPEDPFLLGSYETGGAALSVRVQDGIAYVGTGHSFEIVDVGSSWSPFLLGSLELMGCRAVHVSGGTAYLACSSGLVVVNISEPSSPVQVGRLDIPYTPWGMDIVDDVAYLAATYMYVVDVADPQMPTLLARCWTHDDARDVMVMDFHAYVMTFARGVQVFDVSQPSFPVFRSADTTLYYGTYLTGASDVVYASSGGSLKTIDASDCPSCAADVNGDGAVDTRDLIAFLDAWVVGDESSDWNDDGAVDTRDVVAYLNDWAAGC